jgi:hypothetical protein
VGYFLLELFWSWVGKLLTAGAVGLVVIIWGRFGVSIDKWRSAVGGILVTAAVYLVINQSGWWEPAAKIKIRQWLDESTISVRPIPDNTKVFNYQLTDQWQRVVYVMQPTGGKIVTIESYITGSPPEPFRPIFIGCVNFCQSLIANKKSSGVLVAHAVVMAGAGGR